MPILGAKDWAYFPPLGGEGIPFLIVSAAGTRPLALSRRPGKGFKEVRGREASISAFSCDKQVKTGARMPRDIIQGGFR
jgi:hypothetical protein